MTICIISFLLGFIIVEIVIFISKFWSLRKQNKYFKKREESRWKMEIELNDVKIFLIEKGLLQLFYVWQKEKFKNEKIQ